MDISIKAVGQMAMDGRTSRDAEVTKTNAEAAKAAAVNSENAAKTLAENTAKLKESIHQLQKLSDMMGREVQFNVNNELGKVVVKIVDPTTDKVIKEIPSAEIQKLQIRIRETIGLLLFIIAALLIAVWVICLVTSFTLGGFIYLLLGIAVALVLINIIRLCLRKR